VTVQAEVMGQTITWLVPHQLAQVGGPDIAVLHDDVHLPEDRMNV
jgi:hypothetical protein